MLQKWNSTEFEKGAEHVVFFFTVVGVSCSLAKSYFAVYIKGGQNGNKLFPQFYSYTC